MQTHTHTHCSHTRSHLHMNFSCSQFVNGVCAPIKRIIELIIIFVYAKSQWQAWILKRPYDGCAVRTSGIQHAKQCVYIRAYIRKQHVHATYM